MAAIRVPMVTDEKVMVKDQGLVDRNAVLASKLSGRPARLALTVALPSIGLYLPGVSLPTLAGIGRLVPALALVLASMVVLFLVPPGLFVAATFGSTICMILAAYYLGALRWRLAPNARPQILGLASAFLLYMIFYLGGAFVDAFHPLGVTSASENTIYSLIASPSNPLLLQVGVLLFDSAGYESFFRGVLQKRLQPRLGLAAAPVVALLDAGMHIITLNPIWVGGTFVTDLVWGITYHYGRGIQSSFASHFLWDLAIFIIRPVT
jgi:membrane protease YdiL (CAAX protease family)